SHPMQKFSKRPSPLFISPFDKCPLSPIVFIMNPVFPSSRRTFLKSSGLAALGLSSFAPSLKATAGKTKVGFVTYQWGKDWDLPTLIKNCETAGLLGVELRTTHAHGVEITLDKNQRDEVKKRFADSPVICLGPGSNENF